MNVSIRIEMRNTWNPNKSRWWENITHKRMVIMTFSGKLKFILFVFARSFVEILFLIFLTRFCVWLRHKFVVYNWAQQSKTPILSTNYQHSLMESSFCDAARIELSISKDFEKKKNTFQIGYLSSCAIARNISRIRIIIMDYYYWRSPQLSVYRFRYVFEKLKTNLIRCVCVCVQTLNNHRTSCGSSEFNFQIQQFKISRRFYYTRHVCLFIFRFELFFFVIFFGFFIFRWVWGSWVCLNVFFGSWK